MSVVVPFGGDASAAEAMLARFERLDLRPDDELIVADNTTSGVVVGGSVTTVPALLERSSYHARNVGAERARNEWLLFIDSDCRPAPTLIDDLFASPVQEHCGLVAGGVFAAPEQSALVARYARSRSHINEAYYIQSDARPSGITANLAVRRATWEALGGFQEGVRSGADIEFCWRAQDAGWTLVHRPEARVEHLHVEDLRSLVNKTVRHAAGRAWVNRRYRGSFPRPRLTRSLARCVAGILAWSLMGRFERAAFKALDALWFLADLWGYVARGNRAERSGVQGSIGACRGRLAVVTDVFPALSETFIVNEVRSLIRAGFDVRVEAIARPKRPERSAAREHEVSYLEDDPIAAKLGALLEVVAKHPLLSLGDAHAARRWREAEHVFLGLRSLAPGARRIWSRGDDHLHVHFAGGAALGAMRLSRLTGVSFSLTAHARDIYVEPANLREKIARASFVTSGCDYTVGDLRRLVPRSDRIHRVVMGIDADTLRRRTPYPGGETVLAVGRLVEKKGFAYLVEAIAELRESAPARLLIVGDGPLRADLIARTDELGVSDEVEFMGWREPGAVRDLMERADLLAMPCVVAADGDRDSMPVVVKEALAMELPVVATAEVGLPELVRPEFGLLVPPRDASALACAIGEILARPARERIDMGRAGRSWVLSHCDVDRETARLIELIEGSRPLADKPPRRSGANNSKLGITSGLTARARHRTR